jgi:CBS domain-containing protein
MKEPSARERLRSKLVSELRPRQIPFTVTVDGHLRDVVGQVEGQGAWFITVLEADGRLKTVVNEDDLWRFSTKLQNTDQQSYEQVLDTTIADLVEFVTAPKDYRPSFVTVTPDRTAADANDEMTRAEARLAIVVDEQAKPLSFLTTGDIRRFLLSE